MTTYSVFGSITCLLCVVYLGCDAESARDHVRAERTARTMVTDTTPPAGMVFIPGGRTQIGSERGLPQERPVFWADVDPFFMDRHPVTVARFSAFVDATGYITQAEQFGDAGVIDYESRQWLLVKDATWRRPRGPNGPVAADDHPVTQVSWNDADAYCVWADKRLPSEVEWEHAARGATNNRDQYPWGNSLAEQGRYRANTWNGSFPMQNTGADGYLYTSPVGAFGETALGLSDMGGNVWEWTADWFRPYRDRDQPYRPDSTSEKAQRGGSFLCEPGWCHGYRVSGRSHSTPETALFHVGFRCVRGAGPSAE